MVNFAIAALSSVSTAWNGGVVFHSGCCGANSATRSKANMNCVYIGYSTHVVPSWSKVAMRCSGGTKDGLAGSVVTLTKVTIACFAGPSFHEGRESRACATEWAISVKQNAVEIHKSDRALMSLSPLLKLSAISASSLKSRIWLQASLAANQQIAP